MWQAVRGTLSLLSVKFGGNQWHPTWGTITAKTQGELDLKGDEEMGDQDNSGKVWRRQEDDWGEWWGCVCVWACAPAHGGRERARAGQSLGRSRDSRKARVPSTRAALQLALPTIVGRSSTSLTPLTRLQMTIWDLSCPCLQVGTLSPGHDHGHTVCKRQNLHNPGSTPNALCSLHGDPLLTGGTVIPGQALSNLGPVITTAPHMCDSSPSCSLWSQVYYCRPIAAL